MPEAPRRYRFPGRLSGPGIGGADRFWERGECDPDNQEDAFGRRKKVVRRVYLETSKEFHDGTGLAMVRGRIRVCVFAIDGALRGTALKFRRHQPGGLQSTMERARQPQGEYQQPQP